MCEEVGDGLRKVTRGAFKAPQAGQSFWCSLTHPGVIVIQVYFGKTAWCEPQDYLKKERQSSQPRGWEEEMGMKDPRKMGGQELYSRWEGGHFKALAKMRKVSENLRTTGPAKGIQSAVPPLNL